jgi:hypothetical protein
MTLASFHRTTPDRRFTAMTRRGATCALIAISIGPAPAAAQQSGVPATVVSGIVYDSIARSTIAGVTLEFVNADDPAAGRVHTATSDSSGRYTLRGLPPGRYLAGFFHRGLDTLGLETPARLVSVSGASQRIDLATPSARTVIRTICETPAMSDSTGLLIGHVRRTSDAAPHEGASVTAEWSEFIIDELGIHERTRTAVGRTVSSGWFAICGLPADLILHTRAAHASDSSGYVEVEVPAGGLRHHTFFVGGATAVAASAGDSMAAGRDSGLIAPASVWRGRARLGGTVRDDAGRPVMNAHALVWGTGLSTTTSERGTFMIEGLPGGTHTLEIRVIGYVPVRSTVHLAEGRPATANISLDQRAEILSTVTVRGQLVYSRQLADFERRRRSGFGSYLASADLAKRPGMRLSSLLAEMPGVRVRREGLRSSVTMSSGTRSCVPSVFVDGNPDRSGDFDYLYADDLAAIEVYPRDLLRPFEFRDSNPCGAIVIWTRARTGTVRK